MLLIWIDQEQADEIENAWDEEKINARVKAVDEAELSAYPMSNQEEMADRFPSRRSSSFYTEAKSELFDAVAVL